MVSVVWRMSVFVSISSVAMHARLRISGGQRGEMVLQMSVLFACVLEVYDHSH